MTRRHGFTPRTRSSAQTWRLTLQGAGGRVKIASLGIELDVDEVYRRVFDGADES